MRDMCARPSACFGNPVMRPVRSSIHRYRGHVTGVPHIPCCRNNFVAAWRLSALSGSRLMRAAIAPVLALLLVSLWLILYSLAPPVRAFGDSAVLLAHDALPPALQDSAAALWHALLPSWILTKVLPPPLAARTRSLRCGLESTNRQLTRVWPIHGRASEHTTRRTALVPVLQCASGCSAHLDL